MARVYYVNYTVLINHPDTRTPVFAQAGPYYRADAAVNARDFAGYAFVHDVHLAPHREPLRVLVP